MKILRPISVEKRLPELQSKRFSKYVPIRVVNEEANFDQICYGYCDKKGNWTDSAFMPTSFTEGTFKVVEWYEEIEVESLFPDKDTAYKVASQASGSINGQSLHTEGQDFVRNYFLKKIRQ